MIVTDHFVIAEIIPTVHFAKPVVYVVLKESYFDSALLTE